MGFLLKVRSVNGSWPCWGQWGRAVAFSPCCVASPEHLVGHYMIQNAGPDGSSLVQSRTAYAFKWPSLQEDKTDNGRKV